MSFSTPDIEIFTMVLGHQKRYWWQLSSILDQIPWEGNPVPRIRCVASVSRRDPWWEWNERLVRVFRDRHGLDLVLDVWGEDNQDYGRRGYVRTRNLQRAQAKWVMFNDGDMLYPRQFFAKQAVFASRHAGDHRVMALGRRSTGFDRGYKIIDSVEYEEPVQGGYERALSGAWWLAAHGRACGAGFHQLIDLPAVKEFATSQKWPELCYTSDQYRGDNNIVTSATVRHETKSDREFRLRVGGVVPLSDKNDDVLTGQFHLNHYRRQDPQWRADLHH